MCVCVCVCVCGVCVCVCARVCVCVCTCVCVRVCVPVVLEKRFISTKSFQRLLTCSLACSNLFSTKHQVNVYCVHTVHTYVYRYLVYISSRNACEHVYTCQRGPVCGVCHHLSIRVANDVSHSVWTLISPQIRSVECWLYMWVV